MKKNLLLLVLVIISILLFSGCSTLSLGGSSAPTSSGSKEVDVTGNGLEFKFTTSTKWIATNRRIDYEISLKNSGLEQITLNKKDIQLSSNYRINGDQIPLTQETIDDFYEQLFKSNSQIVLGHDQEISSIKGYFVVDENFFKEKESLDLTITIPYEYKTLFSNNIKIDLKNLELTSLDKVSQAAPVKVTKIELKPGNTLSDYQIGYYLEDKGSSLFSDERIVRIKNFNLKFGTKLIDSSCRVLKKDKSSNFIDIGEANENNLILDKNTKVLIMACPKDFSDYNQDLFTTTTSGSFEYTYIIKQTNSIKFPKKKSNSSW